MLTSFFNNFYHERAASQARPTRKNSDRPPRDRIIHWRLTASEISRSSVATSVSRMNNDTQMIAAAISRRVVLELKEKVPVMQDMSGKTWDVLLILRF